LVSYEDVHIIKDVWINVITGFFLYGRLSLQLLHINWILLKLCMLCCYHIGTYISLWQFDPTIFERFAAHYYFEFFI